MSQNVSPDEDQDEFAEFARSLRGELNLQGEL